MRIYNELNVYEAAKKRINWLFNEFPNVVVSVSGGKDSTVIFHLALEIAQKKNRLPLSVMFVDQEGEWASTVEQIKSIMYHPDVKPFWLQIPLKLFNATSYDDHWLTSWDPESSNSWVHPQDPISLKENIYNVTRFFPLFSAVLRVHFADTPTAYIAGVRVEESPRRSMGLTHRATYKWVTWGKILDKKRNHYTFHPLYDWSYTDIWKAICAEGWPYNQTYDFMYRYGVPSRDMRISNLFHETALRNLFFIQEFEPNTYARLVDRMKGIDTTAKLGSDFFVHKLPFMFESWADYREYLLEHLIDNPLWRDQMSKRFTKFDSDYGGLVEEKKYIADINSILSHDWEGTKVKSHRVAAQDRPDTIGGKIISTEDPRVALRSSPAV